MTTTSRRYQVMKKQIKLVVLVVLLTISATVAFAQKSSGGPALVKDVDSPARQPWVERFEIQLPASATPVHASAEVSVPVDNRLVIESYSGTCPGLQQGIYIYGEVDVTTNGLFLPHFLKFDSLSFVYNGSAQVRWVGTGAVRLYADPGSIVRVWLHKGYSSVGGTACDITLSGHLVDVP